MDEGIKLICFLVSTSSWVVFFLFFPGWMCECSFLSIEVARTTLAPQKLPRQWLGRLGSLCDSADHLHWELDISSHWVHLCCSLTSNRGPDVQTHGPMVCGGEVKIPPPRTPTEGQEFRYMGLRWGPAWGGVGLGWGLSLKPPETYTVLPKL